MAQTASICLTLGLGAMGLMWLFRKRIAFAVDSMEFYFRFSARMPEASRHFCRRYGDPAVVDIFQLGRIVFTARWVALLKVFTV